jgi:hypothetical protein
MCPSNDCPKRRRQVLVVCLRDNHCYILLSATLAYSKLEYQRVTRGRGSPLALVCCEDEQRRPASHGKSGNHRRRAIACSDDDPTAPQCEISLYKGTESRLRLRIPYPLCGHDLKLFRCWNIPSETSGHSTKYWQTLHLQDNSARHVPKSWRVRIETLFVNIDACSSSTNEGLPQHSLTQGPMNPAYQALRPRPPRRGSIGLRREQFVD